MNGLPLDRAPKRENIRRHAVPTLPTVFHAKLAADAARPLSAAHAATREADFVPNPALIQKLRAFADGISVSPFPRDPSDMTWEKAFAVEEPASLTSPVVFASPHSGRAYPEAFLAVCRASFLDLRRIEDAYIDRLLADVPASGAPLIHGLLGRSVIDLNRAETELDPGMFRDAPAFTGAERTPRVDAGLGCLPRVAYNGVGIYTGPLPWREALHRIERVHRPYHTALAALLNRAHATFGVALLIDCHSMPAEPDRREGGLEPGVEIVLGDRYGAACNPGIVALAETLFENKGYRTARNAPYAGGYATILHGKPSAGRHALQIEIRRDLYLDESRVEPGPGFEKMRADLAEIAEVICREAEFAINNAEPHKKKAASDADAAKSLGRKRP